MTPQQQGLLAIQIIASLGILAYLGIMTLEARKSKLKFRFFAVRDRFLYQAATGLLSQDSQVFKVFYRAMNTYISQMEQVTISSFIRASIAAQTELAKENQQRLVDALNRSEPEVQSTVNEFVQIVMEAMLHNNLALNLLVQIAVHCKQLYVWLIQARRISIPIMQTPSIYRVYDTYQFYDGLQVQLRTE